MKPLDDESSSKRGKKVRVDFRRNRAKQPRIKDWTQQARSGDDLHSESAGTESVAGKGAVSRKRTIIQEEDGREHTNLLLGTVVAVRGHFADVDDGQRFIPCTMRRILRTRLTHERHPICVGDRVRYRVESATTGKPDDGVIEAIEPRKGQLQRRVGKKIHTFVANVDQVIIVTSAAEPWPKTHLIDRYIVAALAGGIAPVICMNKIDLDVGGQAASLLDRYQNLGYATVRASATTGVGIDELRRFMQDKASVIAGQSGVGKSSLLNAVQPGLNLTTGEVSETTQKGRHITTTARLIRLEVGGYVVDTPGVRSFELGEVSRGELELYFEEFIEFVPKCRFPDCSHTHEADCAVKQALEDGKIHPERYDSYVKLYTE